MKIGDKHPREDLWWNGFEYVPYIGDLKQEASEGIMAESEDERAEEMLGMNDETRRALAHQVYSTFANPNATSSDVLEAFIGQLALENRIIYTATGELGVHLAAAVEALRAAPAKTTRRFLGMPKE